MVSASAYNQQMPWQAWQRFAFRFVCLYWLQYIFLTWWREPVVWVAKRFLDITITVFPAGSGDTTFNYVQVLLLWVVSVAGTILWSLIDRRKEYSVAHDWLRVILRYWLAMVLMQYGFAKVFKSQFPFPSPERLLVTYGDSSPMGLLWSFMGYSTGYNLFTGLMEVIPGLLMFARRTTTLASLLAIGVMANVVALNFCYDVPVKLYSVHLLLAAVVLAAPDLGRLIRLLVRNRPVEAVPLDPPYQRVWMRRTAAVLQVVISLGAIGSSGIQSYRNAHLYGDLSSRPALGGVYEVQEFALNGKNFEYPQTHHLAWRHLAVGKYGARIVLMNGSGRRIGFQVDGAQRRITVSPEESPWSYQEPDPGHLEVQGKLEGDTFRALLRRIPERELLLVGRGFHWINEYPFNR